MLPLILAAASMASGPFPDCNPQDQAGAILGLSGQARGNGPYVQRQNQTSPPGEYQLLCPQDVLVNPKSSGVTIRYRLSGQEPAVLAPGGQSVTVPAADFQTRMKMLSDRLRDLLDYMNRGAEGVRGAGDDKSVYPLPDKSFAVAAWGPLIVAWHGTAMGTVSVINGAQTTSLSGKGVVKIDLGALCPATCSVTVQVPDDRMSTHTTVIDESVSDAKAALRITQFDPEQAPDLLPHWFVAQKRDPAWQLQEASVLWNSTCAYPAFEREAREYYKVESVEGSCER